MFYCNKSSSMATLLQQKNCMTSLTSGGSNGTNNSTKDDKTATILSAHHDLTTISSTGDVINAVTTNMPNSITSTTSGDSILGPIDNASCFVNQSLIGQQQLQSQNSPDSFQNFNVMNNSHFHYHQSHHIQSYTTRHFQESDFMYMSSSGLHQNVSSSFDINTSTNGNSISLSTAPAYQINDAANISKPNSSLNQEPPISSLLVLQNLNASNQNEKKGIVKYENDTEQQQQIKTENINRQQTNINDIGVNINADQHQNVEEQEPEIDIVINNVVCSFSVRCHLNLREIALNGFNVEFRRENGMVTMKLRRPYTTASIWSSGRITCTGATSEEQAKIAARRYARCLQKLGFSVRFHNFRVVNVLGTCSMPWAIKIVNFSEKYKKEASYEPELHPGVTYKLKYPKATLKIFSTGSITVTAASVAYVQAAIEHIFPLVYEFRKKRTQEELDLLRTKHSVNEELNDDDNEFLHSSNARKKRPPGCAENDPNEDMMNVSDYEIDDQDDCE